MPGDPLAAAHLTVLDASGALAVAIDRAQGSNELTLRDFRGAVAAAGITCRSAATVTAAATGNDADRCWSPDSPGTNVMAGYS